jgi:hypothetical protein
LDADLYSLQHSFYLRNTNRKPDNNPKSLFDLFFLFDLYLYSDRNADLQCLRNLYTKFLTDLHTNQ